MVWSLITNDSPCPCSGFRIDDQLFIYSHWSCFGFEPHPDYDSFSTRVAFEKDSEGALVTFGRDFYLDAPPPHRHQLDDSEPNWVPLLVALIALGW